MATEKIFIQNLKCGGCANTVKSVLTKEIGVQSVDVNVENSLVTIDHTGETKRETFIENLTQKGYPEVEANNGTLTKAKSYVSCMIGRMS